MASILFVMRYPLHKHDNLSIKFDGQMAAAAQLGHDIFYIGYDPKGLYLCEQGKRELLLSTYTGCYPGYEKTIFYIHLMKALKKAFQLHNFDLIYMRFARFFPGAPRSIRYAKSKGCKLILEHPTYPFKNGETTSLIRKPIFALCDHVFKYIEPMIDLYTLIGEDAGECIHGIPAINIVNGVDCSLLPKHKARSQTDQVGLLALASMSQWQGYDRLINAFSNYNGSVNYTVHMVGNDFDGSLEQWKKLVFDKGLSEHFVFHGEKFGSELDQIVEECDIGIGGLGLYRKKQYCSMTLKLREYMARGLPFVYAVDDPSIPAQARYCMRVSNDDTPLQAERILEFAVGIKQDAAISSQMRDYAKRHMSWNGILATVFERVGIH